jgi:general secretion pathway protein M
MRTSPRTEASLRDRVLALGLLLGLVALAYLVVLHGRWTAPMLDVRRELAELRGQELRLRMQAGQRAALDARIAEVRAFEADDAAFLTEPGAALASAALVQRLESLVAEPPGERSTGACTLSHRTPKTVAVDEPFQRIVVQARLRCPMAALGRLIGALETGQPRLFIDRLSVRNARAFGGMDAPTAEPVLDVGFDVYGYLRRDDADAEAQDED